ncbi:TonB-dependent receptor plug domain-containing protein, partial [Escherichia coli]|nr:TonB-dependent receptor plug domain-containing protein [Escherichia coli]
NENNYHYSNHLYFVLMRDEMLYNIPCRIYILSTLSLCISGIVSTATATSSETKISNEETLVVTTNRSASNLWESPATIQVIDQQTLQNSTNASIADNLQDIPGVEITDNSLAGRKQIRIRGEASSRVLILIDGQEVTYQRAGDNYGVGLLIDESALERVEVVKGPYSVLYGSHRQLAVLLTSSPKREVTNLHLEL